LGGGCKYLGIQAWPPGINKNSLGFAVEGKGRCFGLLARKTVGRTGCKVCVRSNTVTFLPAVRLLYQRHCRPCVWAAVFCSAKKGQHGYPPFKNTALLPAPWPRARLAEAVFLF
jgi:hypothetical protein